jgi:hypothetical protein
MNAKTTIGLVVALAIAVAGVWWAHSSGSRGKGAPEAPKAKKLLDPPLEELRGFEIKIGSEPALVFEMQDDKWRMTAPVNWPSEVTNVSGDAAKIKDLEYIQAYSKDDPDRPTNEMTSLDNPLRIVKLTDKDGKSYVVKIGSRQTLSKKTYVQREGSDTIYLVDADLNNDMRKGLADYRGKRVADFNQSDAVRVEVSGEQQYTLVKSEGRWTIDSPVKGRADAAKVNAMLRATSGLSVLKFVDDAPQNPRPYGLAAPRLRVAVTTETKTPKAAPATSAPASGPAEPEYELKTKVVRLAFGGKAEKESFAKLDEEGLPTVFQVSEDAVNQVAPSLGDIRDKKVTSLLTNRVQKIVVSAGDEAVTLTKAGGQWGMVLNLTVGQSVPAEFAAVDDLLKAVRDLTATGFEAEELPTFGLAAPRATIELAAEGQLEPERLTIGGLTASKTGAYVRNDREGLVAVVKAESAEALAVKPTAFLGRDLLRFTASPASKIDLIRQGQPLELVRREGEWWFTAPISGKAEETAVGNILSDLSGLRGRQAVGRAADSAQFGLDSPEVIVKVTVDSPPMAVKKAPRPADTEPATQPGVEPAQPSSQPASQPTTQPAAQGVEEFEMVPQPPVVHVLRAGRHDGKVYAMVEGGISVCEVDAKVLDDLEAELLDTRVTVLNPAEVRRAAFSGQATFTFEKSGTDWVLVDEPSFQADAAKVSNLLNALRDLKAKRYVKYNGANPAEYGLDRPAVAVTVETEAGQTTGLLISSTGPQGGDRYAATTAANDRVFVVAADDVAKIAKQVQDFRKGS